MIRQTTKYPGIYFRERVKGRVYEIAYVDSTNRRVFKTVPGGLRDAQRERARILERMNRGELVAPSKRLVGELADLYLDSVKIRPNTMVVYRSAVKAQIKPRLGEWKVSDLTRRSVGNLVTDMEKDGLAAWTIRGTLTVLSGMCSFAMDEGWLGVNPVLQLTRRQRPTGTRSDMRILSSEEIAQLLRHSNGNHRDLFRLLIFTGLRISEALALDWEDVDFDLACVRIRSSKTDAGVRSVELPEFLLRSLASMNGESGPVFLNQNGNRMYKRQVQKFFKTTLKRAKLDDMRLHDLRHTFASLLIAQGEDIVYVASQMGHSNASTTLRVYARLFDGDKRKIQARERMHEAFQEVGK
jgi:integrase